MRMRWWMALGPLLVCLAVLPHRRGRLELLSPAQQQQQVDQIQQWETRALSGRGQQRGEALAAAPLHSGKGKVIPMIKAWEDSALSG
eukprot:CAMPEP_0206251830 /NCGR_PEP_ID=MMETSP0047_2-20121206/22239_1 /ASSEMBLY_ACC=CAM_ASM_000192 /TAXON_ID=195065 /ORGANISM="Chroomonas mesostigmatica_cf, Strain CCMP1168" /LENGTH=86 /DNA_ID=CAMNT_0053677821 /DNA_START=39 /DNA_END=296 /DNA_ORIENTATION=+